MARRRLPRLVRIGLWSLAGLVVLVVAGATVVALTFDPDSLKPRIVAEVKRATGRDLVMHGPIRLGLSLQPTLVVRGVSFANPPGFSRPQMATLEELDLKLALFPLLENRVEIERLVLIKPDIMLETDAQGRPNWRFVPEPAGPAPPAGTQPAPVDARAEPAPTRLSVAEVRIEDGTLAWRDGRTGSTATVRLAALRATAPSADANLQIVATASYNGAPINLSGEVGSLARLQETGATTPWPVRLQVEAAGAKLALDGTVAQPTDGRGYALKVTADVPSVAALAPFAPGQPLPALRDVNLTAHVADSNGPVPQISDLVLRVGASDLGGTMPGLNLDRLELTAPRLDQPARLDGRATLDGTPAVLAGTIGAPAAMLSGGGSAPVPVDVKFQALGTTATVKGTASQSAGGRPALKADVAVDKLDLDAWSAALVKQQPAPAATPAAGSSATPPADAARPARNGRVIPDTPIPFYLLRQADADVKLTVGQVTSRGAQYRNIAGHIDLRDGKLRLDPFAADLPEGHFEAAVQVDATQPQPPVALKLRSPALALKPALAAIGQPPFIDGNLNLQADLRGAGSTPRAIAAGLDGSLVASMSNGTLDNRLLGGALGTIMRDAAVLDLVGRGGTSQVRCFVARFEIRGGVATLRPFALVSSLLTVDGEGSISLGAETLDLRLRPQGRMGGTGFVVPLRVTGSWRAPNAAPDPAATVAENAGTVAGAVLGSTTPLGIIAGALGGRQVLTGAETPGCAVAGGPAPAAAPAQRPALQAPRLPDLGGTLKQLLR